jgi:hypothetical protein
MSQAFLACAEHGPIIDGQHRGKKAMRYLQEQLQQCMASTDAFDDSYSDLHLWALYVGATWESESDGMMDEHGKWFTRRLQKQVQRQQLTSWEELKMIADGFLSVPSSMGSSAVYFLGMRGAADDHRSCRTAAQSLETALEDKDRSS